MAEANAALDHDDEDFQTGDAGASSTYVSIIRIIQFSNKFLHIVIHNNARLYVKMALSC
jgi:hypothetical protein